MNKNNHYDLNKCTLESWIDKNLDQSPKNIKSGFKVTWIWPLDPKAMDHKTMPFQSLHKHLQTFQMKTLMVLIIQLMGKNSGEKMELLHNQWT